MIYPKDAMAEARKKFDDDMVWAEKIIDGEIARAMAERYNCTIISYAYNCSGANGEYGFPTSVIPVIDQLVSKYKAAGWDIELNTHQQNIVIRWNFEEFESNRQALKYFGFEEGPTGSVPVGESEEI
jgi:hypothetical protein